MKKIKNILTMLAIAPIFYAATVQPPTTLDHLSAPKMWTITHGDEGYTFMRFSGTSMTSGMVSLKDNKTIEGTNLYYLSDSEVTVFDSSKVGKVENGKYIIISRDKETPDILEIKSIDANNLTLFYDSKGKNIPNMTTSTWHAVIETPPADPTPPKKPVDPRAPVVDPLWPVNPGELKPVF